MNPENNPSGGLTYTRGPKHKSYCRPLYHQLKDSVLSGSNGETIAQHVDYVEVLMLTPSVCKFCRVCVFIHPSRFSAVKLVNDIAF